jgi:UDP-galactopyranose mutase
LLNRYAISNRVFIIEEPVFDATSDYYEITKPNEKNNVWVIVMHVAKDAVEEKIDNALSAMIDSMMYANSIRNYMLWYYSPMALSYSEHLHPALTIYDCMDELSAFKFAPPELKEWEQRLLKRADIVFTGGYSLYHAKKHLHHNIHPFPSSIDQSHFMKARIFKGEPADQAAIPHPRLGFYGVIDERFHISLINELSIRRPDWHFVLIGPVIKIDSSMLPQRENIHYTGGKDYNELPSYLAGWDIAMLPFELNESTKYISPTKTPEYLAGGKPVISTSIADVVTPYGKNGLVHIADTAEQFIVEAEKIFSSEDEDKEQWLQEVDAFLATISWNKTWHKMSKLIDEAVYKKTMITNPKKKIYV